MKLTEKYYNYIDIDKDFVAVFGEEADKSNKNLWKTFIPHSKFNETLSVFLPQLTREVSEPKPIWIVGAYGTGKTHAAFVIKHLLSDNLDEVYDYLNKYELPSQIKNKLMELRQNEKFLVVYHYGSSDITSEKKLLLTLQYKIQKELQKFMKETGKSTTLITKTEIELLKEKLTDKMINWSEFLRRHELYEFGIETPEDILERLNKEPLDISFVEYLLDALEEEGLTVFKFSLDAFTNWIKEIKNIVSRIVFIWDEFSDFFNQEHPPLTTLQKLAELTKSIPFYLVLITHRHPEQFKSVQQGDIQKLQARFNFIHYHMESVTVYKLMSNVTRPKNPPQWRELVNKYWDLLSMNYGLEDEIKKLIVEEDNTKVEDMKKLFPIHPYSVYLSARISQWFGSNQRTLFKFLRGDDESPEKVVSFRKFIKEFPKDEWYLLTPDFLWEYFFVSDERIQIFHPELVEIINYWETWRSKLSDKELKIFNLILLITALGKKIQFISPLLRAKFETLRVAFSGTPIYPKLQEIVDSLIEKGVIAESAEEYILPYMGQVDISNIQPPQFNSFIKENPLINSKIRELITKGKNRLKVRFCEDKIQVMSVEDIFRRRIPNVDIEPYQLGIIFGVMQEEISISTLKEKLVEISKDYPNILFIISSIELGEKNWKEIVRYYKFKKANEKVNKIKEAEYFQKNIDSKISSWLSEIEQGRFVVVADIKADRDTLIVEDRVHTARGLSEVLDEIVSQTFKYGLDKWIKNDNLWKFAKQPKEPIKLVLEHFMQLSRKGLYRDVYNLLVNEWRIIDTHGEFIPENCDPDKIPVCAMRKKIKELFGEEKDQISMRILWEEMTKPPFGLYSSPLGALIFALLLKEFSEGYYYTDYVVYGELNTGNLITYILETISEKKEWFILRLSYEQKMFSQLLQEFFELDEKDAKYPRKAIIATRMKIKTHFKYPLWSLKYSEIELSEGEKSLIEVLDLIIKNEEIQKSEGQLPKNIEEAIEDIVATFDDKIMGIEATFIKAKMASLFRKPEYYQEGFFNFILQNLESGWLKKELSGEDIVRKEYFFKKIDDKIRKLLQEEPWAWNENETKLAIVLLESEVLFVKELSQTFNITEEILFIEEFLDRIKNKLSNLEYLPLWMYRYHPESNSEISALFNAMDTMLRIFDPTKIRKEFQFKILYKKVTTHKDALNKILEDRNRVLQSWISSRFSEQLDSESLIKILNEIQELINTKGVSIDEHLVYMRVQGLLDRLKVVKIRKEIETMLINIIGTEDVKIFLRRKILPIELIKYIPDVIDSEVAELEDLIRKLMDITSISSEEALNGIKKLIEKYKDILITMATPGIHYVVFKNFFGEDWLEGFLSIEDLDKFIKELKARYGEEVEYWNSRQIRTFYKEWIKKKYQVEMYNKIQDTLERLSPNELKQIVATIIKEEPDVGLKLAKLIMSLKGDN